ncbi:MAG: GMC family oxidoreductase N-terminal domain-containing protein [bacterium]
MYDVIVVGSGAGGAVAATLLAENGLDVLMIEEGSLERTESFSTDVLRSIRSLYRDAGTTMILGRPGIIFAEGRCVGGSTVINAGICYRTPESVLDDWRREHGLAELAYDKLLPYFEMVEKNLHVMPVPDAIMGQDSLKFKQGAENLGYHYVRVQRNIHACQGTNLCVLGCPTGAKQSTLISYLPEALKNGTQLIANCHADKIVVKNGRVVGVEASAVDPANYKIRHRAYIRARAVFACSGALHTPTLLFRSGLAKRRSWIGRNLYLHPNLKCVGIFDEEIKSWQGSIQGFQIDEFADDGIVFGSTFLPPGILALSLPYFGNDSFKLMEHYHHMSLWGALVEDTHPGRIWRLPNGTSVTTYWINALDRQRFLRAIASLAKIFFAAGARKVLLPIKNFTEINREEEIEQISKLRVRASDFSVFTMHLMGTCRLGADPRTSVIDMNHQFHGIENLFIADASVFPTPIRVNPMITIMALATRAAQRFVENRQRYLLRA